ncbi:hypothetical protein VPH35_041350 [Triticum aestivum]
MDTQIQQRGNSRAVQWWDEQQLRALVLGSLAVQYFLCFSAARRKSRIPPWYRFFIWLSYLGSDALPIYALATLFNRQKRLQYHTGNLQVLWAPVLLMHLGGQLGITAYNIEDNELWKRHFLTALSQVTVAVYVFCKSWPSSADRTLLASAFSPFVAGVLKCFHKPLALMHASFGCLDRYFSPEDSTSRIEGEKQLETYVQEARAAILLRQKDPKLTGKTSIHANLPYTLLLDYADSYSYRVRRLKIVCPYNDEELHSALKGILSNFFDILYTREPKSTTGGEFANDVFARRILYYMVLQIVAIVTFHKSHIEAQSHTDVGVTFVLLYGTLLLEIVSLFGLLTSFMKWYDMVAEHNLIGLFIHKRRQSELMNDSSKDITWLVRQHIQDGWEEYITDAQSYMEFNDVRGQWTVERKGCHKMLGWSLERPLDESVLLWHLATDFCFYCTHTSPDHAERTNQCRQISNYMVHLLSESPEMLFPGSIKHLCRVAYAQLYDILKGHVMENELAQKVVDIVESPQVLQGCFVRDARLIAKRLIRLGDDNKMWEVIQGVWIEMLCFSADRCRGYLHAKSIGTGGEYLSNIWLLLHCTGMETFQHRLQRTQKLRLSKKKPRRHRGSREDDAAPSSSQGMNLPTKDGNVAGPPASPSEGTSPDELNEIVVSLR